MYKIAWCCFWWEIIFSNFNYACVCALILDFNKIKTASWLLTVVALLSAIIIVANSDPLANIMGPAYANIGPGGNKTLLEVHKRLSRLAQ